MPLLIDGYNLMHAAGIIGSGPARTSLERSRIALLKFIAEQVDIVAERQVTVVFDAAGAPPGLPPRLAYRGLDVQFAKGYADADELLEVLIRADTSPRQLTVVSSDHRVQRAAKRRRCLALDSDVWYEQVRQAHHARQRAESEPSPVDEKSIDPGVAYWLEQFVESSADEKPSEVASPFPDDYLQDVADEFDDAARPSPPRRRKRS
ncbi:MAG: NYN domain-containing protein [Planctomycetaceae bacterium]|nr:NYN domain-containing protein [Planctomycetaceae bacterium]